MARKKTKGQDSSLFLEFIQEIRVGLHTDEGIREGVLSARILLAPNILDTPGWELDLKKRADEYREELLSSYQQMGFSISPKEDQPPLSIYPAEEIEGIPPGKPVWDYSGEELEILVRRYREDRGIPDLVKTISKGRKKNSDKLSRDVLELQTAEQEDTLLLKELDNETRREIRKLQDEKKLLTNAALTGLKGGGAKFKKVMLAFAQILSEQSEYYRTDKKLEGVPDSILTKFLPEGRPRNSGPLETIKSKQPVNYPQPVIIITYEDLARRVGGLDDGDRVGGRDLQEMKDYIQTLSIKEFLVPCGNSIIGLPLLNKSSVYDRKTGVEQGAILLLSRYFAQGLDGYAKMRPDTLKKLRGKQTDLTMTLFEILLKGRGNYPEIRRPKKELLRQLVGEKRLKKNPKEVNEEFSASIKIMRDELGIIKDYRETGSVKQCVFTYNPDYLKD